MGAVVHERSDESLECRLHEQHASLEVTFGASGRRLFAYLDLLSKNGPSFFSSDQLHLVDAPNKIYEFVAGRLRLLFFFGAPGRVVICSHMFVKKSQKTPKDEILDAVRWKKKFESETSRQTVQWMDEL